MNTPKALNNIVRRRHQTTNAAPRVCRSLKISLPGPTSSKSARVTNVTLLVNGIERASFVYAQNVTDGEVGLGTRNAITRFDDFVVQPYSGGGMQTQGLGYVADDSTDGNQSTVSFTDSFFGQWADPPAQISSDDTMSHFDGLNLFDWSDDAVDGADEEFIFDDPIAEGI